MTNWERTKPEDPSMRFQNSLQSDSDHDGEALVKARHTDQNRIQTLKMDPWAVIWLLTKAQQRLSIKRTIFSINYARKSVRLCATNFQPYTL